MNYESNQLIPSISNAEGFQGHSLTRSLDTIKRIELELYKPFDFCEQSTNSNLLTNSIGMEFRLIPSGEFHMGSPPIPGRPFLSETQHLTTLTKDFYIGCYQVTQAQYQRVLRENPSFFRAGKGARFCPSHPVENVSWYNAYTFCLFLSALPEEKKEGRAYRLPTEAEWEYACRASSQSAFCFGDEVSMLDQYAWYGRNSQTCTSPVGEKSPNAWGLYDMHGNVFEWCADWYGPYCSVDGCDCIDPTGPDAGYGRVFRGGAFDLNSSMCVSAFRSMSYPTYRMHNLGFRVAISN